MVIIKKRKSLLDERDRSSGMENIKLSASRARIRSDS